MKEFFLHHANPLADKDKHPALTVAEFEYDAARRAAIPHDVASIARLDAARNFYRQEFEHYQQTKSP